MQAAPQPFSGWRTKGTFSQIPAGAAAPRQASPNSAASSFRKWRRTRLRLSDQNYDNRCSQCNYDIREFFIRKRSGGEMVFDFAGLRGKAGQLLIAQRGYRLLDLLQVKPASFERLLGRL